MNKMTSIVITIALLIGFGIMVFGGSKNVDSVQNVEIKDGIQYITINAKGGYSPRKTEAQANIPTQLIVETNGTYDCSLSLSINAISYQKILSSNGKEIIDLGTPKNGKMQGLCSMGMYGFTIDFL